MSLGDCFRVPTRILLAMAAILFLCDHLPAQQESYDPHKLMIARSHYEKGMKLLARDDLEGGEAQLLEAVGVFPQLVEGYLALGNLSMQRGDFTQGLDRYTKAKNALLELQAIKHQQEAERQRRIQESIDLLKERMDEMSRSQRPQDQGKVQQDMVKMERLEQERTNSQPSMETPLTPEVHFLVGTALMKLERFDAAAEEFRQALSLRPKFGEAHNNLAVVLYYRREYAECWEHLRAAEGAGIRVDPGFLDELSAVFPEPAASQAP
jgi:tetratricopeptide (TPR) repeat protein